MPILQDVMSTVDQFYKFRETWEGERESVIAEFSRGAPHLSEFESRISHFERLEDEIQMEAEHYDVGSISLYTGQCP